MDNVLCSECADKETCTELCEEVEKYISQDEVEWKETPITIYTQGEELRVFDTEIGKDVAYLSSMEKAVLCRLGEGKTRNEIAKDLGISRHYTKTLCLRLKNKTAQL